MWMLQCWVSLRLCWVEFSPEHLRSTFHIVSGVYRHHLWTPNKVFKSLPLYTHLPLVEQRQHHYCYSCWLFHKHQTCSLVRDLLLWCKSINPHLKTAQPAVSQDAEMCTFLPRPCCSLLSRSPPLRERFWPASAQTSFERPFYTMWNHTRWFLLMVASFRTKLSLTWPKTVLIFD